MISQRAWGLTNLRVPEANASSTISFETLETLSIVISGSLLISTKLQRILGCERGQEHDVITSRFAPLPTSPVASCT